MVKKLVAMGKIPTTRGKIDQAKADKILLQKIKDTNGTSEPKKPEDHEHVKTIMELGRKLNRTYQYLYKREKEGSIKREALGYDVEKIRATLEGHGEQTNGNLSTKSEAAKWDSEYKKWRARTARMEYAEARGVLTNRADSIKEVVRRESEIVRGLRRMQFDLPPKLHNMPYELWPGIIDGVATEVLDGIVKRITS